MPEQKQAQKAGFLLKPNCPCRANSSTYTYTRYKECRGGEGSIAQRPCPLRSACPAPGEVSPKADKPPVVPEATLTETRGVEGAKLPVKGDFGPIFTQFKGKPQEAIEHLLRVKDGEAVSALHHKDIGEIDLVWGEEGDATRNYKGGYGLAKIVKKHPEVVSNLQNIIAETEVKSKSQGKIQLESLKHKAAIRLDWNRETKHWLLTAFQKEEPPHTRGTSDVSGNKGGMPSPTPRGGSTKTIPPTPGEVKPTPPRDILQEQPAPGEVSPKGGQAGITAESLAEKYPEASIKVKPTKEGYTGQAEYERATYTVSGKTEAEVLERLGKRLVSAVPYEEAQPTRKREPEATAMTPEEMENISTPEEGPSGYASTGGYKRPLKGMEMPEIVEFAKEINEGKYPLIVEKLRGKAVGRFYPKTGDIRVKAELFKDLNEAQGTLAHEIGHLVDWLPDKYIKRGNVLGRIATLKKYLKPSYEELSLADKKKITEELKALSSEWRGPFDAKDKYRNSSGEFNQGEINFVVYRFTLSK